MAFLLLVPLLAMAACTGAVPVPVGMECGLHRHVEDLHTIRSTGSCNLPYNGQNLSPAMCGAGSLESYVAAKPGNTASCAISFTVTIGPGERPSGGDLAFYMLQHHSQSPLYLEPTLVVTIAHPVLGIISSRSVSTISGGWQLFRVGPALQGLPAGTHNISLEPVVLIGAQSRAMTCSEVRSTFLLDPSRPPEEWLGAHTDLGCLSPLLTISVNRSLAATPTIAQKATAVRRQVEDYMQRLYDALPSFIALGCNATFNGQQISAYMCITDHIKSFKEFNNSCKPHSCEVTFNISLHEEAVKGAQLVLYVRRTTANSSTDPMIIQIYQGETLVANKSVRPSEGGWQLFDIEPSNQQWAGSWDLTTFEIRMFRDGGGQHLVPIAPTEVPEWIVLGDSEGSEDLFVPVITVFANYLSRCHQPWPWLCLNSNPPSLLGRRSATGEHQMERTGDINHPRCSTVDRWVPVSNLTPLPQAASSRLTRYDSEAAVVLPANLNIRQCTNQCPHSLAHGNGSGDRGLGACCTPTRYREAHVVLKRSDSSYVTTSLESAVVEECGTVG